MTSNSIPVAPVNTANEYNKAGQVKLNFATALQVSGQWTASTDGGVTNSKRFNINAVIAGATLSSSPSTTWPIPNNANPVISNVFDTARETTPTGRLIENPVEGQVQKWLIDFQYTLKAPVSSDTLYFVLRNPVSGFRQRIAVPIKIAAGFGSIEFTTIADAASIPTPNGYILEAYTDTAWTSCTLQVTAITRISLAFENS